MKPSLESEAWFKAILGQDTPLLEDELPKWLIDYRQQASAMAHSAVKEQLLPHRKQEAWRYTSLSKLQESSFYLNFDYPETNKELPLKDCFSGFKSHKVVFVEGRFNAPLSDLNGLPTDCYVGSLADAMSDFSELISKWVGQSKANQTSIFSQLNNAMFKDGLFVYLPPGTVLRYPIEVVYLSGSEEKLLLSQPHNLMIIENGVDATITERFMSLNPAVHFNNYVTEVFLGPQAILNHVQIQQQNRQSYYLNHLGVTPQSQSKYRGTYLAMGGAMARTELGIDFKHPDAKCTLNGLYLVGDEQVVDFHLDMNHGVPSCQSETHFKGVLFGKGRAVFDGSIVIEKDAQKSQAHLSNKNLLLSRRAEVDSKPQLEIYADDVQCSHGTTVGQLEEEQIYYLRSRGLTEPAARKLLAMGFARDVFADIQISELKRSLENLLESGVKQQ